MYCVQQPHVEATHVHSGTQYNQLARQPASTTDPSSDTTGPARVTDYLLLQIEAKRRQFQFLSAASPGSHC